MPAVTLFISDLHLCGTRPAITGLFLDFLQHRARAADALYILGDLFEYWIGDEATEQEEFRPIVHGLRRLTTSGTPVFVMHGNRDFLMADGFEKATGCRLLADPTRIDLHGTTTLLMHGDSMCTDDVEYMAFRAQVRNTAWQQAFLGKPVAERDKIVRDFREISKNSTASKKPEIMDVNQKAVEAVMRDHGVQRLIHGHTHRPNEHIFTLDGQPARRMVLGDWYEQGSVLSVDARGWALKGLPLEKTLTNEKMKVKS
ncbi:MAG: UDP-2,3-diacylglucosamine diphosphatase [Sulfuricaulis sp.]|uniref:UDP-2,3-diacylglucosamine diphosphatase n=1 Tax=Sulfuricaulis sp. TaxID=2003553 RepID=UPI0025E55938|nr:UDP-2,3-diacylglucosamine diphosphatase [Sulfuricaulis sp.]MCR4347505.1 UDP-2,3-diacylglucosamine diphosphatase [Sulfuricaulis sp.]